MRRIDRVRESATLAIVLAGAALLPLIFVRGITEAFRLPKELLFRGEAIVLVAITLIALVLGARLSRWSWRDRRIAVPLIAFAIFAIVTATSTRPMLSASAFAAAAATLIVFLATLDVARGWIVVAVPIAASLVNAVLVLLEETNIWMPFGVQPGIAHHLQCTALIGNPNEIGSYLGAAFVACAAFIAARTAERRWIGIASAIVLGAGVIASRTLTAMIAVAAATVAMLVLSSRRVALRVIAIAMVIAIVVVIAVAPLRERSQEMVRWLKHGDYNALLTDRLTPFAAAWSMFTDHPVAGVGPGAFAWQYYDYKLQAEVRHPLLRRAYNRGTNYGEVHNDHLQALAEGGLLGYGAFATALVALGSLSFVIDAETDDPRLRFARRLALPLAVFWAVLSLAQFPMESTVVRALLVHFAAVCAAWSRE